MKALRQRQRKRSLPAGRGPKHNREQRFRLPPSAHAPVNGVPVTNQGEHEQQKSDQQQAGSFRGINRVAAMLVVGIVLALSIHHAHCTRARHKPQANALGATLRLISGRIVISYARFPEQSVRQNRAVWSIRTRPRCRESCARMARNCGCRSSRSRCWHCC